MDYVRRQNDKSFLVIRWTTLLTVAALPVFFSLSGNDHFRLPKDLVLRLFAIVITAAGMIIFLKRPGQTDWQSMLRRADTVVVIATLVWTLISTVVATNPLLSAYGLVYVWSAATIYVASQASVRGASTPVCLSIVLVPAVANAVVITLQELKLWSPFRFPPELPPHLHSTGLIGNPDYVGGYLVAPVIVATAAAAIYRRFRFRLLNGIVAAILVGGVFVSQSLTAVIALVLGLMVLAVRWNPRRGFLAICVVATLSVVGVASYPPLKGRFERAKNYALEGDYDALLSGRLGAFLAAWEMVKDRPVTGVGPHCYRFEFYPYRLRVDHKYETLMRYASKGANFAEVHNDHLQLLAESGIPGYGLFLAAIAIVATRGIRRGETERQRLGSIIALPLTVTLTVTMMAQFPLSIAATLATYLFLAAIVLEGTKSPEDT